MAEFKEQLAFDIGRRIEIRGFYAWFVVLPLSGPTVDPEELRDDFVANLSLTLDQEVRLISNSGFDFDKLRSQLNQPDSDTVLIGGLEQSDQADWMVLDINRSGLLRPGAVVLWLTSRALTNLCMYAPNLRSFVGGSIFQLGPSGSILSDSERAQRLADLESHFKMSSAELIAKTESGIRPIEPHLVEWLVLLGRGDLI